jgi:hypothetical protein
LVDLEIDVAVENHALGVTFIMIGVIAYIESGDRRKHAAKHVGIALDPRAGAVFSASCLMRPADAKERQGERERDAAPKQKVPLHLSPHASAQLARV